MSQVSAPGIDSHPLPHVDNYLQVGQKAGASDVHLGVAAPPTWRVHGTLEPMWPDAPILTGEQTVSLAETFMPEVYKDELNARGDSDFAYENEYARYRVSVVRQRLGIEIVFRLVNTHVIVKRQWPKVQFKDKRAITWEEHQAIVTRELNPERKAFYKLAWHMGASQSDLANLEAENIDWEHNVISFARKKTGSIAIMRFDDEVAEILRDLPGNGPLFPYLRTVRSGDRATEFHQRITGLGIKGVSLHSYRYAWAERAKKAGYPERFAQEALGHNSKAIHRAYARRAQVELPPLSEFERMRNNASDRARIVEPVIKILNA